MKPEVREAEHEMRMTGALHATRGQIAMQAAAVAMDLPAGSNFLSGSKARRFRVLYTEAYMSLPSEPVVFPAMCMCDWKAYPHRHGDEERRRFAWQLQQGRAA